MNIEIELLVGIGIPLAGGLFWLGRLEGRMTEIRNNQTQQETRMKQELEHTNSRVDAIEDEQRSSGKELVKLQSEVGMLATQIGVLFKKVEAIPSQVSEAVVNAVNSVLK